MTQAGEPTGTGHRGSNPPSGVARDSIDAGRGPVSAVISGRIDPRDTTLMESTLRRFGLRPERVRASLAHAAGRDRSPLDDHHVCWRVGIGAFSALIGPMVAAAMGATGTDTAGPADPGATAGDRHPIVVIAPDRGDVPDEDVDADRELFKLLAVLIDALGGERLFWSPARLWSDARGFRDAVAEMARTGMPPIVHVVAFVADSADAPVPGACVTRGLRHFVDQELVWTGAAGDLSLGDAARRLARLALDAILHGPIVAPADIAGLSPGESIVLESRGLHHGTEWIAVRQSVDARA